MNKKAPLQIMLIRTMVFYEQLWSELKLKLDVEDVWCEQQLWNEVLK